MRVPIKLRFRGNICLQNQSLDHHRERKNPSKHWDSRSKKDFAYVATQGHFSSPCVSKSVLKSSSSSLDFNAKNMCNESMNECPNRLIRGGKDGQASVTGKPL